MIKAAREKPTSNGGCNAIACWFSRLAETNARKKKKTQDHEHGIVSVRYCPTYKDDMDRDDLRQDWPAALLIVLFV
jgi:hypothetical protein